MLILEGIAETVLEFAFEVGCYWVGRAIVPVVTLGWVKCDAFGTESPPTSELRWGGWMHRREGRPRLTVEATAIAGLTLLVVAGVSAFAVYWFAFRDVA